MGKESMQNRKPMILVLAGTNGSGKSTITIFFYKVGKYTNDDDVVVILSCNTNTIYYTPEFRFWGVFLVCELWYYYNVMIFQKVKREI